MFPDLVDRDAHPEIPEESFWSNPQQLNVHAEMVRRLELLVADNERLRALIKAAEWGDQCGRLGDPSCPWCGVELGGRHEGMGSECPAFAVTGEVR